MSTKHRGRWLSLLGERWAGEGGLHPVRMCKVAVAHDREPAECHRFGAQSGFGKKKLSQLQGGWFPQRWPVFPGQRKGALGWEESSNFSKHHVRPDAGV